MENYTVTIGHDSIMKMACTTVQAEPFIVSVMPSPNNFYNIGNVLIPIQLISNTGVISLQFFKVISDLISLTESLKLRGPKLYAVVGFTDFTSFKLSSVNETLTEIDDSIQFIYDNGTFHIAVK